MVDIPRPFWDHFQELRRALALALGGWLLASIACFNFAGSALAWLLQPPIERLVFTSPAEPFFAYVKLAGFLGFVLAFPWIVYQAWRFIAIALKPDERRVFWELIPVSYGLFLGGGALGLFVICPVAMRFLLSFSSDTLVPFITLGSYLSFVGWTSLGLGLFFQFPLVLFLLAGLGLVAPESFRGYRRHVLLGFLGVAALASSGPIDQVMIAVPAYLLFELSLLLIRVRGRAGGAALGAALLLTAALGFPDAGFCQHEHHDHAHEEMGGMMQGMYGSYPMEREASGTSWRPEASHMHGLHRMTERGVLMAHGYASFVYNRQGGKRGDTMAYSMNEAMLMGYRDSSAGRVGFRAMFDLEPAFGPRGYPLLLQTGETANGRTLLIDRQHPHDLFMELALTYSARIDDESSFFLYAALPGEPAIGPPSFMHRESAEENPEAPIGHHWQDSTHITNGVLTAGFVRRTMKIEFSTFKGKESDERRWDIEKPRFDSRAARLTWNPGRAWSLQASVAHLVEPESLATEGTTDRVTASVMHTRPLAGADVATALVWGRNIDLPARSLKDSYLAESRVTLRSHTLFVRGERVEKDDLIFALPASHPVSVAFFGPTRPQHVPGLALSVKPPEFKVSKATLGYVYDFADTRRVRWGLGGLVGTLWVPAVLQPYYGKHPVSFMVWVRAKLV